MIVDNSDAKPSTLFLWFICLFSHLLSSVFLPYLFRPFLVFPLHICIFLLVGYSLRQFFHPTRTFRMICFNKSSSTSSSSYFRGRVEEKSLALMGVSEC